MDNEDKNTEGILHIHKLNNLGYIYINNSDYIDTQTKQT